MAEILNGKINLAKLNNAVIKEMNGRKGPVKCIIIPVEENNIFCGNNGSAYLSFTCSERPVKSDWGETHTIRPQVGKVSLYDQGRKNGYPFHRRTFSC